MQPTKDMIKNSKGRRSFIQKTKEGMFRDFETEERMLKEALAELDARKKAEKNKEG